MVCLISICTSGLHLLKVSPNIRVDAGLVMVFVRSGGVVVGVMFAFCGSAEVVLLVAGVRWTIQEGN